MRWTDFVERAHTPQDAAREATKDPLFRMHRWVGLRLAYLAHRFGMSANMLSTLRMLMAVAGVSLLLPAQDGRLGPPLVGALLIYAQVLLDFSDGALARARGSHSALGLRFDMMGNDVARSALMVLLGVFAGSGAMLFVALGALYVLTTFRWQVESALPELGGYLVLRRISTLLLSERFLVVIMPFVLVGVVAARGDIARVSQVLVGGYALLAVTWLLVCARQ